MLDSGCGNDSTIGHVLKACSVFDLLHQVAGNLGSGSNFGKLKPEPDHLLIGGLAPAYPACRIRIQRIIGRVVEKGGGDQTRPFGQYSWLLEEIRLLPSEVIPGDRTKPLSVRAKVHEMAESIVGLDLTPRCLIVPQADRMEVHSCRYADRGVSQAFGNSRDLHARSQQVRPMTVAQRVQAHSLRQFQATAERRYRRGHRIGL